MLQKYPRSSNSTHPNQKGIYQATATEHGNQKVSDSHYGDNNTIELINTLEREKKNFQKHIAELESQTRRLTAMVDTRDSKISELNHALSKMNDKIVDQVNKTAEIEYAKETLEHEVEDLSRTLFEEANGMVSKEKRLRVEAETKAVHLNQVISDLKTQSEVEKRQTRELKDLLEKLTQEYDEKLDRLRQENMSIHRGSIDSSSDSNGHNTNRDIVNEGTMIERPFQTVSHLSAISNIGLRPPHSSSSSPRHSGIITSIDDMVLSEFDEFVQTCPQTRMNKITSIPFMRRLVSDYVEPCLRFGSNPRISSRNIIEAIATNTLLIEGITPGVQKAMLANASQAQSSNPGSGAAAAAATNTNTNTTTTTAIAAAAAIPKVVSSKQAMLWERFSGTVLPNPTGCQACGREGQCTYRFRMSSREDEAWVQIDTYCRDRLVAVCEFFGFISLLRRGHLNNHSVIELYQETVRLRLCMYYARVGIYSSLAAVDPSLVAGTALSTGARHHPGISSPQNHGTPRSSLHSDRSTPLGTPGGPSSTSEAKSPSMLNASTSSPSQRNYPSPRSHLVSNVKSPRMRSMSATISISSQLVNDNNSASKNPNGPSPLADHQSLRIDPTQHSSQLADTPIITGETKDRRATVPLDDTANSPTY